MVGVSLSTLCMLMGCPEGSGTSSETAQELSLRGLVQLEGEKDHLGIHVQAAFDGGELVGQGLTNTAGEFVFRNVPGRTMEVRRSATTAFKYVPVSWSPIRDARTNGPWPGFVEHEHNPAASNLQGHPSKQSASNPNPPW